MSIIKIAIKQAINLVRTEKKVPIPHQVNSTELLNGKIALITGGSGGIGEAIATEFLKNGAKVVIAGTSEKKLQRITEKIINRGDGGTYKERLRHIVLNVTDLSSFDNVVLSAAAQFEENRIDILVNSAGVTTHTDFWNITEEEYDRIMDVNTKGTFFICQAVGRYMRDNGIKGHILNVSSSSALRPAWTPYQMSKWAVRGFTLGLADILLPYDITVNAIAPGQVATSMLGKNEGDSIENTHVPIGRYAEPEEIANLAVFMVSDMGDMIVGDTVYITGGSGTISLHK